MFLSTFHGLSASSRPCCSPSKLHRPLLPPYLHPWLSGSLLILVVSTQQNPVLATVSPTPAPTKLNAAGGNRAGVQQELSCNSLRKAGRNEDGVYNNPSGFRAELRTAGRVPYLPPLPSLRADSEGCFLLALALPFHLIHHTSMKWPLPPSRTGQLQGAEEAGRQAALAAGTVCGLAASASRGNLLRMKILRASAQTCRIRTPGASVGPRKLRLSKPSGTS